MSAAAFAAKVQRHDRQSSTAESVQQVAWRVAYWLAPLLVLASGMLAAARAYRSGSPWMIFFEDDFYYYLKVAQNLAHGAGSTFNGIVPTNGYHPLWLLTLTGLSLFTQSGWTVFWSVASLAMLASVITFFLADRILRAAPIATLLRRALAAYIGIYTLHLGYTGMEVILAIPLMFGVLVVLSRQSFSQRGFAASFALGLLVSAAVLARFDLLLFCGLLLLFTLCNRAIRASLSSSQIAGVLAGCLPIVAYLLINHHAFATWLPVSGMAKQLRFTHFPALRPWVSVYQNGAANWINLLPIHTAVVALPFVWKRLAPMQKVIFPATLLFPFVYILVLSCVSDWQLWLWYLYPMRAALCVSFIVLNMFAPVNAVLRRPVVILAVFLVLCAETIRSHWWTVVAPPIYAAAMDLDRFAQTHTGTYAMGDRSGMVGYLLPEPVVQTEGLMMDRTFLEHVRRQDPLLPTLRQYGVRYYVATTIGPRIGCFHALEPAQAGSHSAHMSGTLCIAPVASFQHDQFETLVFDLQSEPAK